MSIKKIAVEIHDFKSKETLYIIECTNGSFIPIVLKNRSKIPLEKSVILENLYKKAKEDKFYSLVLALIGCPSKK